MERRAFAVSEGEVLSGTAIDEEGRMILEGCTLCENSVLVSVVLRNLTLPFYARKSLPSFPRDGLIE